MPHTLWYTLHRLPDLSLGSYASLPHGQHDALLAQFAPSLRMLHRLAISYALELRWWAYFAPNRPAGQRLELALGFAGQPTDLAAAPIDAMLRATPIAPYFEQPTCMQRSDIQPEATPSVAPRLVGCQVARLERYWALTELGDEAFQRHSGLPDYLHAVYPWEINNGCRLVSALQLMQQLGESCVVTMALTPSEGEAEYDRIHPFYAPALAKLAGGSYKDALGRTEFIKAGPVAEQLRSLRQDLLDKLRCEPCFSVQLRCYASTRDKAKMLADTVLAEALQNGPHAAWPLPVDVEYFAPAPSSMLCLPPPVGVGLPPDLQRLASLFAISEIASLFRLPVLHEGEALDIRKETYPEIDCAPGRSLYLGLLQEAGNAGETVSLPLDALVKHTLVVGVPGSGKTNTLLGLANQVWGQFGVPFLALEPAKREYRGLLNLPACSGKVLLFAPGRAAPQEWLMDGDLNPLALQINPFEFPLGYSLAEHCTNLLAVFSGAFGLFSPLPSMVEAALATLYAERGWHLGDLANSERVAHCGFPAMPRFVELLREQADFTDFVGDNAGTVKAGLEYRFGRLVDGPLAGVFGTEHSSLRPEDWLRLPAIVELESLGEANANFLSLLLLTYLREGLTVQQEQEREQGTTTAPGYKLKHLLFLEEAHNLIGPNAITSSEEGNPKAAATAYIVKMLAEVRALGQGIVIGDQLPSNLASEVLKNTSVRICHRLTAPDDRQQMQHSMNASALQFETMATQTSGYALVSLEGVRKPFVVKVAAADGVLERHNQAISDRAFFQAVCQTVSGASGPDARFAANALRMLNHAVEHLADVPWQGIRIGEVLNLQRKNNAVASECKTENEINTRNFAYFLYQSGFALSHLVLDHLARWERVTQRHMVWNSLDVASNAGQALAQATAMQQILVQRYEDLFAAVAMGHDALRQGCPLAEFYISPLYAAYVVAIAHDPRATQENEQIQFIPKNGALAVSWYRRVLTLAANAPEASVLNQQTNLQELLGIVHLGLWQLATPKTSSRAKTHTQKQRNMIHLRLAAAHGLPYAQYLLSRNTEGAEARQWLEQAAISGFALAMQDLEARSDEPQ